MRVYFVGQYNMAGCKWIHPRFDQKVNEDMEIDHLQIVKPTETHWYHKATLGLFDDTGWYIMVCFFDF